MSNCNDGNRFFEKRDDCEVWLNSDEAACYLRMSVNALRIHVCRGHIRAYKVGRRLRFKLHELALLPKLVAPTRDVLLASSTERKKRHGD